MSEGPDHECEVVVYSRTYADHGCPCCAGKQVSVTNSLATLFPHIASQLDPEKNNGVTADQIIAGSHTKYWWKCSRGPDHEWPAIVHSRTSKGTTECRYCTLAPRSRQEIALAFELRIFFDYDIDDHKENADGRIYDCDIIIRRHRLIVEFDGYYYHDGKDSGDIRKTNALRKAGWDVLRVREQPLPLISPMDVSVPHDLNMKPAADAVLLKIRDTLYTKLDGFDDYLNEPACQNARASTAFVRRLLRSIKKAESVESQ